MWILLVVIGILIALTGLAVITGGILIFISTFGNTLITTGAVAASGGFVIIAMGLVLRQMERLSHKMDAVIAADREARPQTAETAPANRPSEPSGYFVTERSAENAASIAQPTRHADAPEPAAQPRAPQSPAEHGNVAEPAVPEFPPYPAPVREPRPLQPPVLDPMLAARRERLERRGELPYQDEAEPAPVNPFARTGHELPPRMRMPEPRAPEVAPAAPVAPSPAPAPLHAPEVPPVPEEPRILKSGIVGGMAYTLYSDGSIQAELPDGEVRFASLQELRDHVARAQLAR